MSFIKIFVPFSYFYLTRLKRKRDLLFLVYYEWLLQFLLLAWFLARPYPATALQLALAYLAFICVYEIGYFVNDNISVQFEANPRKRSEGLTYNNFQFFSWILLRVLIFLGVAYYLNVLGSAGWWGFYLVLVFYFGLHNYLRDEQYKIFTFVGLALLRFLAPVFPFLGREALLIAVPPVLLYYVLSRTITYMESKSLLSLPSRGRPEFRLYFYLLFMPVGAIMASWAQSPVPLLINLYYLFFGIVTWAVQYRMQKD